IFAMRGHNQWKVGPGRLVGHTLEQKRKVAVPEDVVTEKTSSRSNGHFFAKPGKARTGGRLKPAPLENRYRPVRLLLIADMHQNSLLKHGRFFFHRHKDLGD